MELGNETKKTKVGQSECKISFCEAGDLLSFVSLTTLLS